MRGRQVSWRESLADPAVTHGPEMEGSPAQSSTEEAELEAEVGGEAPGAWGTVSVLEG